MERELEEEGGHSRLASQSTRACLRPAPPDSVDIAYFFNIGTWATKCLKDHTQ